MSAVDPLGPVRVAPATLVFIASLSSRVIRVVSRKSTSPVPSVGSEARTKGAKESLETLKSSAPSPR